MRLARIARGGSVALLGGVIGSAGCTHNYYYGNVPVCPPATTVAPGVVQYGASCDVPTQVVDGSSATQSPSRSSATNGALPPRVVVSEPIIGPPRFPSWRRTDPDSGLATTRVEGALDDPTVTK